MTLPLDQPSNDEASEPETSTDQPSTVPPPARPAPERSQFHLWHLLLLMTDVALLFWMLRLMADGNSLAGPAGLPILYAIIMLLAAMFVAERQRVRPLERIAIVTSAAGIASAVGARLAG